MTNIERSLDIWSDTLSEIHETLFLSCKEWNPDVWNLVTSINAGMTIVASSLIVLFFSFGIVKEGITLQTIKHPEVTFALLLRPAVTIGLVNVSMSIMIYTFQIIQGCLYKISGYGDFSYEVTVPDAVNTVLEEASLFSFDGVKIGLMGLLFILVIFILSIILLVIVWGRFINLYIHCAVSGCFLSTLASEPTQHVAASFIKSYLNALFQGVIILLALMIYTALITSDHSAAVEAIEASDQMGGLMLYAKDYLVGALVMLAAAKAADNYASKMGL